MASITHSERHDCGRPPARDCRESPASTAASLPPTVWTATPNTDYTDGNKGRSHASYKIAGAAASSYTFTLTGGSGKVLAGGILAITGAGTSAPINASLGQVDGTVSLLLPAPSITTTVAKTLLVYGGFIKAPLTFVPPALMSEQWDVHTTGTYNIAAETATQVLASAGASGARSPATARGVAVMIARAP